MAKAKASSSAKLGKHHPPAGRGNRQRTETIKRNAYEGTII